MRIRISKFLALVDIMIVLGMIAYTGIILKDWRVEYINPPDTENQIPLWIAIYFHGSTATSTLRPPDVNVAVFLDFKGILTPGKGVHVSAFGNSTPAATIQYEQIKVIQILFQVSLAFPPRNDSHGFPLTNSLMLYRVNNQSNDFKGSDIDIYWPIPGDFAPQMTLATSHYGSQTEPSSLYAVHVEPSSEELSMKFNRVSQGLTVVLTAFAFVEAISLASENLKSEKPTDTDPKERAQAQSRSTKH